MGSRRRHGTFSRRSASSRRWDHGRKGPRLVGDRPEGDGVPGPGERLELHAPAGGGRGHHHLAALVDAYVVHVAGGVTRLVEEHQVARPGCGEPSIGRPIWNTSLHALTTERALLPPGVEGELFIGGAGVARGYLGRPELTAERFLSNPYGPGQLYRTGDRVRWRQNGELEFLGRADDQIKINGIRVEPGEIEAALLRLPEIAAAVVALSESTGNVARLVAYLVPTFEQRHRRKTCARRWSGNCRGAWYPRSLSGSTPCQ